MTNLRQQVGQSIDFHSLYTKMRLRSMLKICLAFWKSEPQYACKRYAYKKNMYDNSYLQTAFFCHSWRASLSPGTPVELEEDRPHSHCALPDGIHRGREAGKCCVHGSDSQLLLWVTLWCKFQSRCGRSMKLKGNIKQTSCSSWKSIFLGMDRKFWILLRNS